MSLPAGVVFVVVVVLGACGAPRPAARGAAPRPRRRRAHALLHMLGVLATIVALGPMPAAIVVVGMWSMRRWRRISAQKARRAASVRAHPDALDLLVLAVRAGHLPAAAVGVVLPYLPDAVRPAYAAVHHRLTRGDRFADAVDELVTHIGHTARPLVDALAAADRYGLPLAPVLDRLADEARQQRRRAAEAATRELPVRLAAPLVLCTLPSFVLLAIAPLLIGALSSLTT